MRFILIDGGDYCRVIDAPNFHLARIWAKTLALKLHKVVSIKKGS